MLSIDIGLSTLAVFVPASIALIVSPGPDSLYVLSRSISDGRWTGLAAAVGTCTGLLVHTLAAVLGLSAILRASSLAYTVVKIAGAVYLVYLGIQTIRQKEDFRPQKNDIETDIDESYWRGAMINVLNPKVAIFFLAFLPQFVGAGPIRGSKCCCSEDSSRRSRCCISSFWPSCRVKSRTYSGPILACPTSSGGPPRR